MVMSRLAWHKVATMVGRCRGLLLALVALLLAGMLPGSALAQATAAAMAPAAPAAVSAASAACTGTDASAVLDGIRTLGVDVADIRLARRADYIAMSRRAELLVFRPYEADAAHPRLAYRLVLLDIASQQPLNLLRQDDISAEPATQGAMGSDFRVAESTAPKTRLLFTPRLPGNQGFEPPPWKSTRLLLVGCDAANLPQVKGSIDFQRSSVGWSRLMAVLVCVLCYVCAATGTYYVHQRARMDPGQQDAQQPKSGTNYASWWQHLNPVVLTAGSNGLGSASKLQVTFFSVLIFGVLAYIWMLSGHLTEMSSTVLLLMGISGIGATASAGAELARNRLDFDNWSWLVNRAWLPKGGVAEANVATWKDIVTTGGEFDATRFQMVTFSLLVGGALLVSGAQLLDLSAFEIPSTLLGILGLSQVVYVGGKLTAPPAMSDLNTQIGKLRKSEAALLVAKTRLNAGALAPTTVPIVDDPDMQAAVAAFMAYIGDWETTRTMFESTLGRLVSPEAENLRPPFDVPDAVKRMANTLPDGVVGRAYTQVLTATGGVAPYVWTLVQGRLPAGLTLSAQGQIAGVPTSGGSERFTLRVADANGASNARQFVINV